MLGAGISSQQRGWAPPTENSPLDGCRTSVSKAGVGEVPAGGGSAAALHRAGASGLLSARVSRDPTRNLFFRVSPCAGCGLESSWKISVSFTVPQFDH